jgi:hypothetical protein
MRFIIISLVALMPGLAVAQQYYTGEIIGPCPSSVIGGFACAGQGYVQRSDEGFVYFACPNEGTCQDNGGDVYCA